MKNNNLEIIRQACIKANPEIGKPIKYFDGPIIYHPVGEGRVISDTPSRYPIFREIRLADVLLALKKKGIVTCITCPDNEIAISVLETHIVIIWDLTKPTELQSEEMIKFLVELLNE